MQVILNQDVKGLGKKLDKVNVSEGYARNFLFPKDLAVVVTNKTELEMVAKKNSIKFKKDTNKDAAEKLKAKLEEGFVEISMKTGEHGKLFGSVTNKEISELIEKKYNVHLDKKKIELKVAIKTPGMYLANIKLDEGVTGSVKVRVIGV